MDEDLALVLSMWCCVGDEFYSLSGTSTMESDNMPHIWILKRLGMANFSYMSKQNKLITFQMQR